MNAVLEAKTTSKTTPVAYWSDGYWDMDLEAAKDADQFGVFGNDKHRIAEVDAGLEGPEIEVIILELLAKERAAGDDNG